MGATAPAAEVSWYGGRRGHDLSNFFEILKILISCHKIFVLLLLVEIKVLNYIGKSLNLPPYSTGTWVARRPCRAPPPACLFLRLYVNSTNTKAGTEQAGVSLKHKSGHKINFKSSKELFIKICESGACAPSYWYTL